MPPRPPRSARSYAALDLALLPPILLGWDPTGGENSGRAHATLRARGLPLRIGGKLGPASGNPMDVRATVIGLAEDVLQESIIRIWSNR